MNVAELELIFRQNYVDIASFCARRLPAADVDDAVSEIFMTLSRRASEVDTATARPWLFVVARNVVGTHHRSARRKHAAEQRLASGRHLRAVPDTATTVTETDLVAQASARLSAADRELLELISWEGLTTSELAAVFDCSTSAIHVRVHRLRDRLRAHMNDLLDPPTADRYGASS